MHRRRERRLVEHEVRHFTTSDGDEPLLLRGQVEQIGVAPRSDRERSAERKAGSAGAGRRDGFRSRRSHGCDPRNGASSCSPARRSAVSATAWSMAARASPRRVRVTAEIIAELEKLCPLAPLHQPHNLAPIKAIAAAAPHIRRSPASTRRSTMPSRSLRRSYAIPRELTEVRHPAIRIPRPVL